MFLFVWFCLLLPIDNFMSLNNNKYQHYHSESCRQGFLKENFLIYTIEQLTKYLTTVIGGIDAKFVI